VARVHMAMLDPNPPVAGKGQAELESAGIVTSVGLEAEQARELNEAYVKYVTTGLPFITVKLAMSLDGKIATHSGDSKWISSEESRQFAHNLRYNHDAIMTGVNTVRADDPQLTTRCCGGRGGTTKKQPLRVIVDGHGRTPMSARVFHERGRNLLVFGRPPTSEEAQTFAGLNAEVLFLPADNGIINLRQLFQALGQRQITSVLVEGGGILNGSLFDQGVVDKVIVFIAPIIIGGEAKIAIAGHGVEKVADAYNLEHITIARFGADIMVQGYISAKERRSTIATCSPA